MSAKISFGTLYDKWMQGGGQSNGNLVSMDEGKREAYFDLSTPLRLDNITLDPEERHTITVSFELKEDQPLQRGALTPQENAVKGILTICPNPANQTVKVKATGTILTSIQIGDITGRILITNQNQPFSTGSYSINISSLTPGIYFIKAVDEKGKIFTGKITVTH